MLFILLHLSLTHQLFSLSLLPPLSLSLSLLPSLSLSLSLPKPNMFPSSASSSSQGSMASSGGGGGLMRYGSAPSSLLSTAVDSVIGPAREFEAQTHLRPARFFASETAESTAMANHNDAVSRRNREEQTKTNTTIGLQTSSSRFGGGGGGGSSLLRHSSSPAGFLNQLAAAAGDVNGFSITQGVGSYNSKGIGEQSGGGISSRLNSQHSFSSGKEGLSRISEEAEEQMATGLTIAGISSSAHSNYGSMASSWDQHAASNPIMFSVNRPKNNLDIPLDTMESQQQFQFSISQTAQDMASMEKLLNIPQDSVTCKIRAKRGCATHPRSIAERERRTRISGKLKKLQDLVPNMDKQTSYSDMLDLAVQHIKTLQNQVQKLHNEMENCKCGCNKSGDL